MADLWLRPDQDGLTLSKITQGLVFKDTFPDPAGSDEAWYYVKATDLDDGTYAAYCFKDTGKNSFRLPIPYTRYNRRYQVTISRFNIPVSSSYVPPVQTKMEEAPPTPADVDPQWFVKESPAIVVYTPAFPHTWLIPKKRELKKSKPYLITKMNDFIQFTKVPGLEEYQIHIVSAGNGALVYEEKHTKQNHEYYFVPANIPLMGFNRIYKVRARAKVTEYRKDYGPFCFVRTPEFPEPKFRKKEGGVDIDFTSVPIGTTYIRLNEKIPGATGYIFELSSVDPTAASFSQNDVTTLTSKLSYRLQVALKWFSATSKPKVVSNPQTIQHNTTYWIRCQGLRWYDPASEGVQQVGPFNEWLEFTTEPAPPM